MRDVEKMIGIGLVWGTTNAVMRRGALISDHKLRCTADGGHRLLKNWLHLPLTWQYSVPFALNVSASAAFFYILGDSPISLAVPVTNATTFAATALSASALGEPTHLPYALLGTSLIILGLSICISS